MNTNEHGLRRMGRRLAGGVMAGAIALAWAACSLPEAMPDLTRFYVLTPAGTKSEVAAAADEAGVKETAALRRVLIRSVFVPEFLRGKLMPVRLANNEIQFMDTARWAEPLEPGLERVVSENLAARGAGVQLVQRGGDPHDYEVAIQLRRCEGELPAGVARLAAHVTIYAAGLDRTLVAEDDFTTEVPGWDGKDYRQLAEKLSEAAAALSDRILALLPAAKP